MANSIDYSALSTFIDEVGGKLIQEQIAESKLASIVDIRPGIVGTQKINKMSVNAALQAFDCGTPSPTLSGISFTQREITVVNIKQEMEFCDSQLLPYWMGQKMRPTSLQDGIIFENVVLDLITKDINDKLETLSFQGDTGSSDLIDGLNTILAADGTKITAISGTTIDDTNIEAEIRAMALAIPKAQKGKKHVLFASMTDFEYFILAMNAKTVGYDITAYDSVNFSAKIPGFTNITIVGFSGQEDSKLILTPAENVVIATGTEAEVADVKTEYQFRENTVLTRAQWLYGINVYDPTLVVCNY